MYIKQMYPNIPIHIFLIGGAKIGKTFILKLLIIKIYHQT
jgi:hypothetical protein